MNKIYQLLEIAGTLLKRILRGKDIPRSEATKLADQVRESIAMVDKGTSKIDEQLKQLRQISDQIDAYEAGSPLAGVKVAGQEPIEELLKQISKDTGATFDEIRDAIRTEVNMGYAPDDPKRLAILDDEGLREYIQVQYLMGNKDDITRTVMDAIGPRKSKADEYKDIFSGDKPKKNLGLTDDEIRFLSTDDATYKDVSGRATMTAKETAVVTSHLSNTGKTFQRINAPLLKKFLRLQDSLTGKLVGASYKTYNNTKVRAGQAVTDPKGHANGYITHVENHFQKEIEKLKTQKSKDVLETKKTEYLREFKKMLPNLQQVTAFQMHLVNAKMEIVKKLNSVKGLTDTFIKTSNGFKVVNPEGYVAIDRVSGDAVKLVDRMEFSFNNFTAIKAWDK
mgnify:CR=1 FL=1